MNKVSREDAEDAKRGWLRYGHPSKTMNRPDLPAFLVVLALLTLLAPTTAAQPESLRVTPDTLRWQGYDPPFVILNAGADSLRVDSMDVGPCTMPCADFFEPMYLLELVYGSTWHLGEIWHEPDEDLYRWDGWPYFPDIVLAPGDSATLRVSVIDTCPVCRPAGGLVWVPFYFWAGDNPDSLRRTLEFDYFLAVEEVAQSPAHTLTVTGPNPFRGRTQVTLRGDEAEVTVALHDALGRRIRVLHRGLLLAGTAPIRVDGEGLSPGLFFVRASTGSGAQTTFYTVPLVLLR